MVPNTRGFSVSDHRGLGEYLTKVNILLEEGPFTEEDTFYRDIMGMESHNSPMTVDRRAGAFCEGRGSRDLLGSR